MKKLLLLLALALTLGLSACVNTPDPDPNPDPDPITCTDDQELVDGVCVDKDDPNPDPVYDSRGLVPEECGHLENDGDYQPVWCEEFDYEGLPNSEKWYYDVGGSGFGNNERQYYTFQDLDNASVSDGTLKITAIEESMGGQDFTSARLITKYRGDWLYGKFEVRAKVPTGKGTWSAVWMLPTQYEYGAWPHSGEIDIMEHVGYDDDQIYGTIHTGEYNHKNNNQIGFPKTVNTATTEFHTYTLEWEPGSMEVFVDGDSYGRFGFNPLFNVGIENSEAWPFDQEFHMLLNLAIGGDWGGLQGVDESIFPATMEVDYVRVYQKDYAGLDNEAPSSISDLTVLNTTPQSLQFMWDKATDDVMVEEYEVYIDGELHGTTTVNSYTAHDLDPDTFYDIDVYAKDFADNLSEKTSLALKTDALKDITTRIEAEDYSNSEGVFREDTLDTEGDKDVTYLSVNDYMEYELYVPEDGTYKIVYRYQGDNDGEVKLYGKTVLPIATTVLPSTVTYADQESTTFSLQEGIYTFKIKVTDDGFVLNYFEFVKID